MSPLIRINGKDFPQPDLGASLLVSTLVDAGRNAQGEVIAQKIGRDQYKVDKLKWTYLSAETWSQILQEFDNFYAEVSFPDMVHNSWTTLKMYPGDRTAEPFEADESTGLPKSYRNCCVNVIDTGT